MENNEVIPTVKCYRFSQLDADIQYDLINEKYDDVMKHIEYDLTRGVFYRHLDSFLSIALITGINALSITSDHLVLDILPIANTSFIEQTEQDMINAIEKIIKNLEDNKHIFAESFKAAYCNARNTEADFDYNETLGSFVWKFIHNEFSKAYTYYVRMKNDYAYMLEHFTGKRHHIEYSDVEETMFHKYYTSYGYLIPHLD